MMYNNRYITHTPGSNTPIGPHVRETNTSEKYYDPAVELWFDYESDPGCFRCGNPADYNFEFDSNYCATCNAWLEGLCKDRSCIFCPQRPKYPKYTD